jgi:hypothetical protein
MIRETVDTRVVKALADAMLNEAYYRRIANYAHVADNVIKWVSAVLGAFTVATIVKQNTGAATWSSAGVTAISLLAIQFRFGDLARKWGELGTEWSHMVAAVREIDMSSKPDDSRAVSIGKVVASMEKLQAKDSPRFTWFARRVQRQVEHELSDRFELPADAK